MTEPRHDADRDAAARVTAAFAALARTEVPDTAAVPPAPRPPVDDRRRRIAIVAASGVAAAAAVALAVVVGGQVAQVRGEGQGPAASVAPATTSSSTAAPTAGPSTAGPTTTAPSVPPSTSAVETPPTAEAPAMASLALVTAEFAAVAGSDRSEVVPVPGGFEAADLADGTVRFWAHRDEAGAVWGVVGMSTYPADAGGGAHTATVAAAALLTGMQHATFVVEGPFTGDSTGNALAYTADGADWGIIRAGDGGLLYPTPDGFPAVGNTDAANIGLSRGFGLADGELQTVDCAADAPDNASCGVAPYRVEKSWRWNGSAFAPAS